MMTFNIVTPFVLFTSVSTSEQKHQPFASAAAPPKKRKRTSVARPSEPSEAPEVVSAVSTPQPSTSDADMLSFLNLVPRPSATISPDELPVCSGVAPGPQPSTAPLPDDGPLMIHNRSVEEYQRLYHEVVDPMLRCVGVRIIFQSDHHDLLP
ncbi:hypothetical protein ABVT39_015018 [Epinephelus coioides]